MKTVGWSVCIRSIQEEEEDTTRSDRLNRLKKKIPHVLYLFSCDKVSSFSRSHITCNSSNQQQQCAVHRVRCCGSLRNGGKKRGRRIYMKHPISTGGKKKKKKKFHRLDVRCCCCCSRRGVEQNLLEKTSSQQRNLR